MFFLFCFFVLFFCFCFLFCFCFFDCLFVCFLCVCVFVFLFFFCFFFIFSCKTVCRASDQMTESVVRCEAFFFSCLVLLVNLVKKDHLGPVVCQDMRVIRFISKLLGFSHTDEV